MTQRRQFDRRTFLSGVGTVALGGTVGATPSVGTTRLSEQPRDGRYDFDTVYSRIGTNSSKWDRQIARYGRDNIEVGMGTADQDFRSAPAITRALRERVESSRSS